MSKKFSIFSVYGIEAEYMIVNKTTLKVVPMADKIIQKLNQGKIVNEVELGEVSWSNELVNHVLEIKSTIPQSDLVKMESQFHKSIKDVNEILSEYDCQLMPTAMHPWFQPLEETKLWPHGQRDIYKLYDEIFDCKGHGWSNLQSIHINLPYSNEEEFRRLHSAVRCVLPLIPYFSASSPYYEGKPGSLACNRLGFYEKNQAKIPSIIGNIIPEVYENTKKYKEMLKTIYQEISVYDNAKTLQHPWLNSRAAIPKFDVGAIEIRLMDIQESPYMDFTLIHLFIALVKHVAGKSISLAESLSDQKLRKIYEEAKTYQPQISDTEYFELFDVSGKNMEEFSQNLMQKFRSEIPSRYHKGLETFITRGNLSRRLTQSSLSEEKYRTLTQILQKNEVF
ncbi:MAG: glutamate--cysteine ligase [Halobacteriovoraceae bacterium]|nr:glutamate--cysteine ligase [Halobacteriovoraceae bacterium]